MSSCRCLPSPTGRRGEHHSPTNQTATAECTSDSGSSRHGFNDNLLITERQLEEWAQLPSGRLRKKATVTDGVALRDAKLWLHRNVPLSRTAYLDSDPLPLELKRGIWVAQEEHGKRLPILGLKALADNRLSIVINTVEEHLTLEQNESAVKVS